MDHDIRLAYSALTTQIRVSFGKEALREEKRPPKDLVRRAKSKLEDEQSKGLIEGFTLYEDSLQAFWDYLRALPDEALNRSATFVLAQGFRNPRGFTLRFDSQQKVWLLTLPAAVEVLTKMQWYRFLAWAFHTMDMPASGQQLLQSRLLEAYFRALHGEKIQDFSLAAPLLVLTGSGSRVLHDKEGHRFLLCLNDGGSLIEAEASKELGQKLIAYLNRLAEKSSSPFVLLKKELQEYLKDLHGAPESFGFGLPLLFPIAYKAAGVAAEVKVGSPSTNVATTETPTRGAVQQGSKAAAPAKTKNKKAAAAPRTADTLIEIEVLPGDMEARISWSNAEKLRNGSYDVDRTWIEKALEAAGITYGFKSCIDAILNKLTLSESITGEIIARGLEAQGGDRAFLYPLYLKKPVVDDEGQIDMRSAQNKSVVEVGDVICELRFRDGIQGYDVYGKARQAKVPSHLDRVEIGAGVEKRDDGRYYSLIRGIPKLDRASFVSCREVYYHPGDVNLKSGDIHFDGDVEVQGSIDSGARVYAKGDLIVGGSIGHARIRCGGDLNVAKGIMTTNDGMIFIGGSCHAEFIENSRLIAGGKVEAIKSIVNCSVKCGGEVKIRMARTGLIGGGSIIAQSGISTARIGFHDGEKTIVRIGSDWQLEYKMEAMQKREQRLRRFQQELLLQIEELKRRAGQGEKIAQMDKRAVKARKLADKIGRSLEALRSRMRWVDEAMLLVYSSIDSNIDITIGGRGVPITKELNEVMITGVRFRDQFINPLAFRFQYLKQIAQRAS